MTALVLVCRNTTAETAPNSKAVGCKTEELEGAEKFCQVELNTR